MNVLALALALLLASCAPVNAGPFMGVGGADIATYLNRQSGQIHHFRDVSPTFPWHTPPVEGQAIFRMRAGNAYADCKSELEAKGYVRL